MPTSNDMPLASRPVNRAAHRRLDREGLVKARQSDDVLVLALRSGEPLLDGPCGPPVGFGKTHRGPARPLFWLGPEAFELAAGAPDIFLGEDTKGAPIFAVDLPADFELTGSPLEGLASFEEMRGAVQMLPELDANLTATARSLFEWHRRHGFCANCGAETNIVEAGWKRVCPSCGAEHWPRTDPVAIMLAVRGDKCLLGRGAGWPDGFVSALAGFVEPGETVEQAAARELEEEAGIKADPAKAEYLFCQPWPFPSSLMMGLILPAETEEISVEQDELEFATWISRAEARQMLAGEHPDYFCPPPMAVAHHILKAWAEREL
ncbi:MAG: NAD(+) diphosphatase [Pseudomonadota bacterium]